MQAIARVSSSRNVGIRGAISISRVRFSSRGHGESLSSGTGSGSGVSPCKALSILEPLVQRDAMEHRDTVELVWTKVCGIRGHRALPFFTWLVEMGEVKCKSVILIIIRRLRKRGKHDMALELVKWLVSSQKKFDVNDKDHVMLIDYYARVDLHLAEMAFSKLPPEKRTDEAHNYLLAAYVHRNMLEQSLELMEKMRELNLVSRFALEQMAILFHKLRLNRRLPALLVEAKSLGIHLHPHLLNTYLKIQRLQGDLEGMEKTFEQLENAGNSNAWSYVFMATAFVRGGCPERASAALGAAEAGMRNGRFKKHRGVYNRILKQYGLMGDVSGIERVWAVLNRKPLVALHNYLFMVEALGNAGKVSRAEEIFAELKEKLSGQELTQEQLVVMIGVYTKNGLIEKANQLMMEMPLNKHRMAPATELYQHFIRGYIKRGEKEQALEAYEEGQCVVKHRSDRRWYETMLLVMGIHAERGDVPGALEVFKHCKSARYNDIRMFEMLFRTYLAAGAPAHGLMKRMLELGFEPNDTIRELICQLEPIRERFYKDRLERRIFGKPQLQWLRWAETDVQFRYFKRPLHRRVRELYHRVYLHYRVKPRVWSSSDPRVWSSSDPRVWSRS